MMGHSMGHKGDRSRNAADTRGHGYDGSNRDGILRARCVYLSGWRSMDQNDRLQRNVNAWIYWQLQQLHSKGSEDR